MARESDKKFLEIWPICFIRFLAVVELIAAIILLGTEFGNAAANFWLTNVFAGGWCGLIMFIHVLLLMCAGCCCPGTSSAFRVVVVTIIALVACTVLIGFDAYFLAQPGACLLTSSCSSNADSNTTFSYNFQSSFFTAFTSLSTFKSYTQTQTKFLFQSMQLGIGALCFLICVIYLVIYYSTKSQLKGQVLPSSQSQERSIKKSSQPVSNISPREAYYPPLPLPPPPPLPPAAQQYYQSSGPILHPPTYVSQTPTGQQYYQSSGPVWRPPAYVPQAPPGQIPWNQYRRQ
ncbi:unnamed protein product [Rotaria magnacalcarata]